MGLFNKKKKEPVKEQVEERGIGLEGLFYNGMCSYSASKALRLSACYCATSQISNSCGILPLMIMKGLGNEKEQQFNHSLHSLLNQKPDLKHNHFNFFKQMIESVLLRGAGYALIERDNRLNVKKLTYIDYDLVTPMPQPDGTIKYLVVGANRVLEADEMIDFHLHVDEMYKGISVIRYATRALENAYEADNTALNFFKSGGNLAGVLKPNSPINNEQRQQAAEAWKNSFANTTDKIPVVIMPFGLDFQAISVDPSDAQLLESREFSIEEIARFFNIPPYKLYSNMGKVDASNEIESLQSLYLLDTILPITTMMSEELENKLFKPSERGKYSIDFDFSYMYKTSKASEADYYRTLITNGIMTLSEARSRLGLPPVDGSCADTHFIQLSYANANDIAEGKYIHGEQQDPKSNVKNDNKVTQNNEE